MTWPSGFRMSRHVALAVAALLGAFALVAREVLDGGATTAFDERVVRAVRNPLDPERVAGPAAFTEIARDFTALGGGAFLAIVVAGVAVFLFLMRKKHALVAILVATAGGWLLSAVLKNAFERPRPSVVPHLSIVHSSSFPSGHSLLAAVVYLTLASMLVPLVASRALKAYVVVVALFLVVTVGASRVLLGVHYPSDVAAGWLVGAAWALVCGEAMRALQRRDVVEEPGETT
jgi:undecaprenyl-diphosphatase